MSELIRKKVHMKLVDEITSPFRGRPLFFLTTGWPSTAILMGWFSAYTFATSVPEKSVL